MNSLAIRNCIRLGQLQIFYLFLIRLELKSADLRKPAIELKFELELHLLKSKQL